MDANCGPSTALQNLSKHTQKDNSLQRQHQNIPQPQTGIQNFRLNTADSRLNNDFQRFNNGNDFANSFMNQVNVKPGFPQPQQHHSPVPQAQQGWVNDFSTLSINNQPPQMMAKNVPAQQNADWHQQFIQSQQGMQQQQQQNIQQQNIQQQGIHSMAPNYAVGQGFRMNMRTDLSAPVYAQQSEHQEIHKIEEQQKQFESQFDAIEKELQNSEQQQQQQQQELHTIEIAGDGDKEKFAETARKVEQSMHNVNSQNMEMKDKFQNSDFLKLMKSIGNRQVELEGDKLVDVNSGQDIRQQEHGEAKVSEQPPLYRVHDPMFTDDGFTRQQESIHPEPILVPQAIDPEMAHANKQPLSQENKLPDPLAHIKDGELGDIIDPFSAARIVSGGQVTMTDWMDDSDDDAYGMFELGSPNLQRGRIVDQAWQEVFDDYRHDDDFH